MESFGIWKRHSIWASWCTIFCQQFSSLSRILCSDNICLRISLNITLYHLLLIPLYMHQLTCFALSGLLRCRSYSVCGGLRYVPIWGMVSRYFYYFWICSFLLCGCSIPVHATLAQLLSGYIWHMRLMFLLLTVSLNVLLQCTLISFQIPLRSSCLMSRFRYVR